MDADLAALYGVTTGRLNEQVKRNVKRFPLDFMFELTKEEFTNLISQFPVGAGAAHHPRVKVPQYLGTLESTSSLHRKIPPVRFRTRRKPMA